MALPGKLESLWIDSSEGSIYPALPGAMDIEVAVIGGGISGLTAALLLQRAGKKVALLERFRIASGESAYTTAHLTAAVDARYHKLLSAFGTEGAHLVALASNEAIDRIEQLVRDEAIDCGFVRLPGYLYSERKDDLPMLQEEAEASRKVGLDVSLTDELPLPFKVAGAIRYERQAQFHPRSYLLALAKAFVNGGGLIFEKTRVLGVHDGAPCTIETELGELRAQQVLVTANTPISNRVFLHTKIYAYRTYAVAVKVAKPLGGLFWDTDDPYHYTRSQTVRGEEQLIVGGEDHKTGSDRDTELRYERLVEYAQKKFKVKSVDYRWSGQIIETADGLPYIGLNSLSRHVYVATGYSGNGMTFGTLAGQLLSELVQGRPSRYAKLFDATRTKPFASAKEYIVENLSVAKHFLKDRVAPPDGTSVQEVLPGEGRILQLGGKRLAVFRDSHGAVHALSPVCPHLGCHVNWNTAERSWDCPCHGSRFSPTGKMVNGPSTVDLKPETLPE